MVNCLVSWNVETTLVTELLRTRIFVSQSPEMGVESIGVESDGLIVTATAALLTMRHCEVYFHWAILCLDRQPGYTEREQYGLSDIQ